MLLIPDGAMSGTRFELVDVFTNNCAHAQALFLDLNTPSVFVNPVCRSFISKGYAASNDKLYD